MPAEAPKGPVAGMTTPAPEAANWLKMDEVPQTQHDRPGHETSSNQIYGVAQHHAPSPVKADVFGERGARAQRSEFNIGQDGAQTAIKVNQAPGGNSSIAIAEDHKWMGAQKSKETAVFVPTDEAPVSVTN